MRSPFKAMVLAQEKEHEEMDKDALYVALHRKQRRR